MKSSMFLLEKLKEKLREPGQPKPTPRLRHYCRRVSWTLAALEDAVVVVVDGVPVGLRGVVAFGYDACSDGAELRAGVWSLGRQEVALGCARRVAASS